MSNKDSYLTIHLNTIDLNEENSHVFGAFTSVKAAKQALDDIARKHNLCNKLCGLEKATNACFAYQLRRCFGACLNKEEPADYNARVNEALEKFKTDAWPFVNAIAIKEENLKAALSQWLVFNNWRHITTVSHLEDLTPELLLQNRANNDRDGYKILRGFLNNNENLSKLQVLT